MTCDHMGDPCRGSPVFMWLHVQEQEHVQEQDMYHKKYGKRRNVGKSSRDLTARSPSSHLVKRTCAVSGNITKIMT